MTFSVQLVLVCVLAIPAMITLVWWGTAIFVMRRTRRELGSAESGLSLEPKMPPAPVRIIVPAHNEQSVIAGLIESLRCQGHPDFRVVLALDRCTDATREVALGAIDGDSRFEIIEIAECPPDWAGKVHAIHLAVARTSARPEELLLFADADTIFHPACVRACTAILESRGLDALSLLSTLTFERDFERIAQGPAAFELLVRYPPRKASRDRRRRPFANGQFILIRRAAYDAIGGHAAFRGELLEDIAMARALWKQRLPMQVLPAGELLICRMYPDAASFERGWRRIFIEAANRKPRRLAAWARGTLIRGCYSPIATAVGLAFGLLMWGAGWSGALWPALAAFSLLALGVWAWAIGWYLCGAGIRTAGELVRIMLNWPRGSVRLAHMLRGAATDLRRRVPTGWAGKTYERPAR